MSQLPTTPQAPYNDDFDADKNFLRVLFKPGVAVQVRELNQVQSILQNQIGNFADHIFDDGSVVLGGAVKFDADYKYAKLTLPVNESISAIIGREISNQNGVLAEIVHAEAAGNGDPFTIYLNYKEGANGGEGEFQPSDTLSGIESSPSVDSVIDSGVDAVGSGAAVHIDNGVYYFNSTFVAVAAQSLLVSKYSSTPTVNVGLDMPKDYVNSSQDSSLYDNAAGTPNFTAPGADRLRIVPTLIKEDDVVNDEDYIELISIKNGVVAEVVRHADYSLIEETLARRTFDESGDYVVNNFDAIIKDHPTDTDKVRLELDPGKAYVRGYEVETSYPTELDVDRARDVADVNNASFYPELGNYFAGYFDGAVTAPISLTNPLYAEIHDNGGQIGYCYVRAIRQTNEPVATNPAETKRWALHVMGIAYTSSGAPIKVVIPSMGNAEFISGPAPTILDLKASNNKSALFEVGGTTISTVSDMSLANYTTVTSSGTGASNVALGSTPDTLNKNDYTVYDADADAFLEVESVTSGGTINLKTAATAGSNNITITKPTANTNAGLRLKTTTTDTASAVAADSTIYLGKADVYEIVSILDNNSTDLSAYYRLNTGQTDLFYGESTLTKTGALPAGADDPITVTFKYFSHGSGEYFSVDSYDVPYEDIPTYTTSAGKKLFLSDVLDFRTTQSGGFGAGGDPTLKFSTAQNKVLVHGRSVQFDYDYYLGRMDKVVVSKDGEFSILKGASSTNPLSPRDKDSSLTLHELYIPPYTRASSEVLVIPQDNRRWTMKDIGRIEKRVDRIENYISLSELEKKVADTQFFDADGDPVAKLGFVTDRFDGHSIGDTTHPSYNIAVSLQKGEALPDTHTRSINLEFDDLESTNHSLAANTVTMDYTEVEEASQKNTNVLERINRFSSNRWLGQMTITPATDTWVANAPPVIFDNSGRFSQIVDSSEDPRVTTRPFVGIDKPVNHFIQSKGLFSSVLGAVTFGLLGGGGSSSSQPASTYRPDTTPSAPEEERSIPVIPYMRQRLISFSAQGLKPNTRVYPYFDRLGISALTKPTGGNNGDPLYTASDGSISGTFQIPNGVRIGSRDFVLLDTAAFDTNAPIVAMATYTVFGDDASAPGEDAIRRQRSEFTTFNSSGISETNSDPLAQTFKVSTPGGVLATSVDLYFGNEDEDNVPVSVEIRTTNGNGKPTKRVIPGSQSTKLTVNHYDPDGVTDELKYKKTTFEFSHPVYLEENREYAILVRTNSVARTLWVGRIGWIDRILNRRNHKNNNVGTLFRRSRGHWIEYPHDDIRFNLNRASFDTNQNTIVAFDNETNPADTGLEGDIYSSVLPDNPFTVLRKDSNQFDLLVLHPNHGFRNLDQVTFSEDVADPNPRSGIHDADLFKSHQITLVDQDHYVIKGVTTDAAGFNATSLNERIGGTGIRATQYTGFSTMFLKTDAKAYPGTTLSWTLKGYKKNNTVDGSAFPVKANQYEDLDAVRIVRASGNGDLQVYATLSTDRENVAPIIDIDGTAVIGSVNRISSEVYDEGYDNGTAGTNAHTLGDTGPNTTDTDPEASAVDIEMERASDASRARYLTKQVQLTTTATTLRVFADVSVPASTKIACYVQFDVDGTTDKNWTLVPTLEPVPTTVNPEEFHEASWEIEEESGFSSFRLKFVMYYDSSHPENQGAHKATVSVPRMRDLRAIATL